LSDRMRKALLNRYGAEAPPPHRPTAAPQREDRILNRQIDEQIIDLII